MPTSGDEPAFPLLESEFRKSQARFSPDGRWIAYTGSESGVGEIFVQPYPEVGRAKWQVSTAGGSGAHWRGDGGELYYLAPDYTIMAVDVQSAGDAFEFGLPRPLFATGLTPPPPGALPDTYWDVTADGERFLINLPLTAGSAAPDTPPAPSAEPERPIKVIVNWAAELERR